MLSIYDMDKDCENIYNGPLPLTTYSKIEWAGFSEEGLFIVSDTKGFLRAFVELKKWQVIWD
jgi:hypothetical protein